MRRKNYPDWWYSNEIKKKWSYLDNILKYKEIPPNFELTEAILKEIWITKDNIIWLNNLLKNLRKEVKIDKNKIILINKKENYTKNH